MDWFEQSNISLSAQPG